MTLRALLVWVEEPVPGETKRELAPPLSAQEAADLYECLLQDTVEVVRELASQMPVTPFFAYHRQGAEPYFRELAPEFRLVRQRGQELGERLESVLTAVQALGYDQVAAIRADGPGIPSSYLSDTFTLLDDPQTDAVFGPSEDGGYYLIAWERPFPRLLREVQMATSHSLSDTLDLARLEKAGVKLLPSWYVVDSEADLERLREDANAGENTRAFFSSQH